MTDKPLTEHAQEQAVADIERDRLDALRERDNIKILLDNERATNADLRRALDLREQLTIPKPPRWAKPRKKPARGHATAIAVLTDQHYGEVVNPAENRGRNAYNPEIAELRTRRAAEKFIEMAEQRSDVKAWDGLVMLWPGDVVAGELRAEDQRTNALTKQETVAWAVPRLVAHLHTLLEFYPAIHVVCTVGNHGRDDKKQTAKQIAIRNWDWLVYDLVAQHFTGDERVTFDIPTGPDAVFSVYGEHHVLTHGNKKSGGSGWGGVASPWLRMADLIRTDFSVAEKIHVTCSWWGHWHTYADMRRLGFVASGTLKGYDEFAKKLSLSYAPATQTWAAANQEHGVFEVSEVFVADQKAEGW